MKTVLIVDDEYDIVSILEFVFSEEGYTVRVAYNGIEALEVLKEQPYPDVILSDVMMPKMDGYSLLKAVRMNPEYKNIPFILVSAGQLDPEQLQKMPYDFFIRKPFDLDTLLGIVEKAISDKKKS